MHTFSASALQASTLKYEIDASGNGDLVNGVGTLAAGLGGSFNIADPSLTAGTKLDISTLPNGSYIPTGNKYTVAIYDNKGDGSGWNGKKFNNDINGYVYMTGTFPRQFLIKYNDTNPGGNFVSEANAASGANANTRFVTLVAVPELGSFLTMGLVGLCAWGAARFGKRFGFKAMRV